MTTFFSTGGGRGLKRGMSALAVSLAAVMPPSAFAQIPASDRPPATPKSYRIIDLGIPAGYDGTAARSVNGRGQVLVIVIRKKKTHKKDWSWTGTADTRFYLWQDGKAGAVVPLLASALNGRGQVAVARDPGGLIDFLSLRAMLWSAGAVRPLAADTEGDVSTATALNDRGDAVGSVFPFSGPSHAVLWQGGKRISLGSLPGFPAAASPTSDAAGVNDADEVVGSEDVSQDTSRASGWLLHPTRHAFLWRGGRMEDLNTLTPLKGAVISEASAINGRGLILAEVTRWRPDPEQPGRSKLVSQDWVLWTPGGCQTLGGLEPAGMNDLGQVVGRVKGVRGPDRAALWAGGRLTDLNALLPPGSGWRLEEADGISRCGWIVGGGRLRGRPHAFLMTPAL